MGASDAGAYADVLRSLDEIPAAPDPSLRYRHRLDVRAAVRDLVSHREVLVSLAERQLRARYKRAVLGGLWAVITPIVLMVAFSLVFNRVTKVDTGGVPYQLFSYLGLVPWTFLSSSMSGGMNSLIGNFALVNKVHCPRMVFPLSAVLVAAFDAVLSCIALVVLFGLNSYTPASTSYWAPLLLLLIVALQVAGLAMFVGVVTVFLRDLKLALPLLLQVGLFATPVGYGFDELPVALRMPMAIINPISAAIEGLRESVLVGVAPDTGYTLAALGGAIATFVLSFVVFRRLEPGIADVA